MKCPTITADCSVLAAAVAAERARCLAHARKWIGYTNTETCCETVLQAGHNEAAKHIAAAIQSGDEA